ncbi:hypothetical protein [Streptomyces sp. NPDC006668]|uniref:hypothetical protein n=1 Tax=Streptomyces sp. NPDC006668 TaxID=3156903 RepID=UPI0033E7753E
MIVVNETAARDPWGLGWEALVAIATFALAAVTVWLAWSTRQLAQETAADERAQWRPVLVSAADRDNLFERTGGIVRYTDSSNGTLTTYLNVVIRNVGRGPALHTRAHLELPGVPGGVSPRIGRPLGPLAPDDGQVLTFEIPAAESRAQLLLDYRDVTGRPHATSITVESAEQGAYVYDVRTWENRSVTTLGDAVYPQDGLRDVGPTKSGKHSLFNRRKN